MSTWEIQKKQEDDFARLMQTGTSQELAKEALMYIEIDRNDEAGECDNAIPSAMDLVQRIIDIESPTTPVAPALAQMIKNVRETVLTSDSATGRHALVELIWIVGNEILPRWPEMGNLLVEAMAIECRPPRKTTTI